MQISHMILVSNKFNRFLNLNVDILYNPHLTHINHGKYKHKLLNYMILHIEC